MKTMNIRERLEAFWSGERPDQIPYTIYQNEWRHTANDPAWIPMFERGLGVTHHIPSVRETYDTVDFSREITEEGGHTLERRSIKTPIGEIYETFSDGWQTKFYLETAHDYEVMTYAVRHTNVVPAFEEFMRIDREVAPYGIAMVMLGRTPNQTILVDFVGLENYAYHLSDLRTEMSDLYAALLDKFRRKVELSAEGPGRFVSVLENFTADTMGPKRYRELLLPVYNELFPILQSAGKIVGTHYDGQLSACKQWIAQAPMDLIESLTPPPEGDMTLTECRKIWPEKLFWSNINVACYDLAPAQLKEVVLQRCQEAAPDGRRLAFEVSEQYPANWKESIPVVLEALEETRA